jgi:hypothetical protein
MKDAEQMDNILALLQANIDAIPSAYDSMGDTLIQLKKENQYLAIMERLHFQIWSYSESVSLLIAKQKYDEAGMLLRYMFETISLMQYFYERPYESERWWDLQKVIAPAPPYKKQDFYEYKRYDKKTFLKFLQKNGYYETLPLVNHKNWNRAMWFSPIYIRRNIDHSKFFNDGTNREMAKGANELYNILSKYVHPSIEILDYQQGRDIEFESLIFKIILNFLDIANKIFLWLFGDHLSDKVRKEINALIFQGIELFNSELYKELVDLAFEYYSDEKW